MKIVAISMVKNEVDIIESFVRHTLSFSDCILIADHCSIDGTLSVSKSLKEEGLPVILFSVNEVGHVQAKVMTELMHLAASEYNADIVIPLDADEFLLSSNGKTYEERNPRHILELLKRGSVTQINLLDCTIKNNYNPQLFILESNFTICQKYSHKVIVGRDLAESPSNNLNYGNHLITVKKSDNRYENIVGDTITSIFLAHFPYRNEEQYLAKNLVGWISTVIEKSMHTIFNSHWKKNFDKFIEDKEIKPDFNLSINENILLHGNFPKLFIYSQYNNFK